MALDTGPGLRMWTGDCLIFCTRFLPAIKCWNNKVLNVNSLPAKATDTVAGHSGSGAITLKFWLNPHCQIILIVLELRLVPKAYKTGGTGIICDGIHPRRPLASGLDPETALFRLAVFHFHRGGGYPSGRTFEYRSVVVGTPSGHDAPESVDG